MVKEWKFIHICVDGQAVDIDGLNPWDYKWAAIDEPPVEVTHPQYPSQRHKMCQYKIVSDQKTVVFAAGEYSSCVWGFYVPA